ncbi:MAG TPA: peptide-methionine (S)-S-oxide reductase MsrA [Porticoccaceae bacterium]|nr:peptide-methionine (S)-S-oxide reductase MsrA [Porticoccaceae bacterium]
MIQYHRATPKLNAALQDSQEKFSLFRREKTLLDLPAPADAIADRAEPVQFSPLHYVSGNPIVEPVPDHLRQAVFGLGCFWGAERLFWQLPGVFSTAVGYAGGITGNPRYEDVCSGRTGHTEVVLVFYDPATVSFQTLLGAFWESHDPTQGMGQGNDRGSQYRSAIYTVGDEQLQQAKQGKVQFQAALRDSNYAEITTEIMPLGEFYYAEGYHQQYLAKNPDGYCSLAGTGAYYAPARADT